MIIKTAGHSFDRIVMAFVAWRCKKSVKTGDFPQVSNVQIGQLLISEDNCLRISVRWFLGK